MKACRFLREEVVGVVLLEIDSHPLAVAPQVIGELPVGMALVAGPEGVLEALPSGLAVGAGLTESPLADEGRAVAGVAKHFRDRHFLRPQRRVAFGERAVSPDPPVAGVHPGHEGGPRRRTHRAAGIVLREPHAFARETIERGRLELGLPVGAQIAIAQIVRLDQQDVRRRLRLRALARRIRARAPAGQEPRLSAFWSYLLEALHNRRGPAEAGRHLTVVIIRR